MDNVTHTLAGVAIAQSWNHFRKGASAGEKRAAFWASVVGSNIPDIDYVARYLPGVHGQDIRLAYLLHHRGFTHTALFLPLLAVLSALFAMGVSRMGKFAGSRERLRVLRLLTLIAGLGIVGHVAMDFGNDYGVHPFSPFWDRWFYGDTLFILEPAIWLALIPWAVEGATHVTARVAWAILGVGVLVACWVLPIIPFSVAAALTVFGALMALTQWRLKGPWPAWTSFTLILWVSIVASAVARGQARETLARLAPTETITDLILTPMPANPFCRRLIALSIDEDGTYRARIGAKSIWQRAFPPASCQFRYETLRGSAHAAPWEEPSLPSQDGILWQGEFTGSFDLMVELIRANCKFAAALNFARAPFWTSGEEDASGRPGKLLVGDLRYDRGKDGGFAAFQIQGREDCGWYLPAWEPPFFRHYSLERGWE